MARKDMNFSSAPFSVKIRLILATGFFSGCVPWAPGTAGSLAGVLLYCLLEGLGVPYLIALPILFFSGAGLAGWAEGFFNEKDSKRIVIDEITGMFIALGPFRAGSGFWITDPAYIKTLAAGFILFRIFDIVKPFPIRRLEKIKGGWGVMLDDALAGLYALILLSGLERFTGILG